MSYTVKDVIERIRFYTATENELIGKAANELFSNKNIVGQLKFALDAYAKTTKALQTIYSLPVDKEVAVIDEPPYILRSEGIRFFVWFINGYAYPISEQNLNNTYANFPSPIQGLPKWFNYWNDTITFYPQNGNGYNKTSLTADVKITDTVIEVETTSGFAPKNGRFTLGSEKIKYEYKDGTHFYNCTRGIEDTEKSEHFLQPAYDVSSFEVYVNNVEVSNIKLPYNNHGFTILKNGIASGFSSSNYLKVPLNNITYNNELKLRFKANIGTSTNSLESLVNLKVNDDTGILIYKDSREGRTPSFTCRIKQRGTDTLWHPNWLDVTFNNQNYIFELIIKANVSEITLNVFSEDGVLVHSDTRTDATVIQQPLTEMQLGYYDYTAFQGSIDLKACQLIVDGKVILNGENTKIKEQNLIKENNVWVYYHRLHFDIPVNPDDSIREEILNKKMLIVDEHIEIICNYAAFCLLSKVDAQRASYYKVNFDEWLRQAKRDIIKGRSRIQKTGWIREPYQFEQESAYWGL